MKTFKDLEFERTSIGTQATMSFKNEYGVSVITGGYGDSENPYELGVTYKGGLVYTTSVTSDVEGYLTPLEVTKIMRQVQRLDRFKWTDLKTVFYSLLKRIKDFWNGDSVASKIKSYLGKIPRWE